MGNCNEACMKPEEGKTESTAMRGGEKNHPDDIAAMEGSQPGSRNNAVSENILPSPRLIGTPRAGSHAGVERQNSSREHLAVIEGYSGGMEKRLEGVSEKEGYQFQGELKSQEGSRGLKGFMERLEVEHGVYRGETKDGVPEGQGVLTLDNETVYSGLFKAGAIVGKGKFEDLSNCVVYEGEFLDFSFHGQGRLVFPDGCIYEGGFNMGKFEGTGSFRFEQGEVFEGDFKRGKRHGEGLFKDKNGKTVYQGEWVKDKPKEGGLEQSLVYKLPKYQL